MKNSLFFLTMTCLILLPACAAPTIEQKVAKRMCECMKIGAPKEASDSQGWLNDLAGGLIAAQCMNDIATDIDLDPNFEGLDEKRIWAALEKECSEFKKIFDYWKK